MNTFPGADAQMMMDGCPPLLLLALLAIAGGEYFAHLSAPSMRFWSQNHGASVHLGNLNLKSNKGVSAKTKGVVRCREDAEVEKMILSLLCHHLSHNSSESDGMMYLRSIAHSISVRLM